MHLLAVSTWQTECSARVVLTLGNNVCQLPDINTAPHSNSSVSKTCGRGKPNKISCQKSYFCQHYISSSIYQEGSGNGLLWCAKSHTLCCCFRLAWPFLRDRLLFFLKNPVICKNLIPRLSVQLPPWGVGMALMTGAWRCTFLLLPLQDKENVHVRFQQALLPSGNFSPVLQREYAW